MFKILTITIVSLLVSVIAGCATTNNILFGKEIEEDITKLLKRHKINDVEMKCYSGFIDSGYRYCILVKTPQLLERLIKELNLKDFEAVSENKYFGDFYASYWSAYLNNRELRDRPYTCGYLKKFNNLKKVKVYGNIKVYGNLDEARSLELTTTKSFKEFFLYHRLDTDEVCIHVAYTRG